MYGVDYSSDGKLLAIGGANCEIQLWNIKKRQHLITFKEHKNWVRSVRFSPDNKPLLVAVQTLQSEFGT
ncbi:MAG: WD40 repeat domain-containing protein [Leptolyngbyaceae cyanobacterium]